MIGDRRPFQRAGTARTQAKMLLHWYRDDTRAAAPTADQGLSQATPYRYLHEDIDVLAVHAPDLREALAQAQSNGLPHLILDGPLIPTGWLVERRDKGNHLVMKAGTKALAGKSKSSPTLLVSRPGPPRWSPDRPTNKVRRMASRKVWDARRLVVLEVTVPLPW